MRRLLAELPLYEFFEWYDYFFELYHPPGSSPAPPGQPVGYATVEEEIAFFKAATGFNAE